MKTISRHLTPLPLLTGLLCCAVWPMTACAQQAQADAPAAPTAPAASTPDCASDPTLPLTALPLTELSSLVEGSEGCVLLFELYAAWCGPCVRLAPEVSRLSKTYQPQGLLVRGVSVDTDRELLAKFLGNHGGTFAPVVLEDWTLAELKTELAEVGGEFQDAVPLFLLFDRQGKLLHQASEPEGEEPLKLLEAAIQGAL